MTSKKPAQPEGKRQRGERRTMMTVAFKRRFKRLIITTTERQNLFAKEMEKYGVHLPASTISRWVNESDGLVPDAIELKIISMLAPEISIDYLLGNKPPVTETERFIEKKIAMIGMGQTR